MSLKSDHPPIWPVGPGLRGRCPRCGPGKLFDGFIKLAARCDGCGLDYGFADAGDGPAVFVIMIVGAVVVGLALWTEITYEPPYWVHVLIFLPLTAILGLGVLRPLKGLMIALQFRNKAEEGHVRP